MTKNNNMKLKKPKKPKIQRYQKKKIPKIIKIEQKELLNYKGRFKNN